MSSCEFDPMWPAEVSTAFTNLTFPKIAAETARIPSSLKGLHLIELRDSPACATPIEERVDPPGPDLVQVSYERGFSEGRDQGIAEGCEKILPTMETLGGLIQALEQTHDEFRANLERGLHALAIAVARHMIQREVTADPSIVGDLLERALDLVPHDVTLEVRLNPEDLEVLQGRLDQLEVAGRPLHVQWIGDTSLERGSFLLETPLRVVDGRTDEALCALYERLDHD